MYHVIECCNAIGPHTSRGRCLASTVWGSSRGDKTMCLIVITRTTNLASKGARLLNCRSA